MQYEEMNPLKIKGMELGPIATNAFLLWRDGMTQAVLVDAPPNCAEEVNNALAKENLTLSEIWLTHGHWDHMAGADELNGEGIRIIGHIDDRVMFEQPSIMANFAIPGIRMEPIEVTHWVKEGEVLDFFGSPVEVRHCPGHCPGNIAFWFKDDSCCFVGDVIFRESVGRYDLPGGDFEKLEVSIQEKIYSLPPETKLLVGHGPPTTVSHEMQNNPFVRPKSL
jgi:hydroxyacylglutathione hydrolase